MSKKGKKGTLRAARAKCFAHVPGAVPSDCISRFCRVRYQVTVFQDSDGYDSDLLGGCVIVSALRAPRRFTPANKAPILGRRVRGCGRTLTPATPIHYSGK